MFDLLTQYKYSTGSTEKSLAKLKPVHDLTEYSTDKTLAKLKPKRNKYYDMNQVLFLVPEAFIFTRAILLIDFA